MVSIYVINVLLKSGHNIKLAVHAFKARQKDDMTGYIDIQFNPVDRQELARIRTSLRDMTICTLSSLNVGQVEAITVLHEI